MKLKNDNLIAADGVTKVAKAPAKKKRGRPLSFNREEALEKAMLLFWQYGYEATSISDLTAAMGVSAPSLYTAFGDKEKLFMESVRLYEANKGCAAKQIFADAPTARIALEMYLRNNAVMLTRPSLPHGCMIVTAATNCSNESSRVQQALTDQRHESKQQIRDRLARGVREGDLAATVDIEQLTGFFCSVIQGMTIQARDGASADELMAVGEMAMAAWPD